MARQLLRCASVQNYLLENVFAKSAPTRGTTTSSTAATDEAPVLIFHSKPTRQALSSVSNFVTMFENDVQRNHHEQLRPIISATIQSYFPTRQDVQDAQELIHATGSTTVLGVGSGVAMDLVKSVDVDQKVLIPGTSTAVMAVQTPYSLILDMDSQVLWTKMTTPKLTKAESDKMNNLDLLTHFQYKNHMTSIAQPGTIISQPYTAPACRSILIEACYRIPERLPDLHLAKIALAFDTVIEGPFITAWHLEGGQGVATTARTEEGASVVLRSAPLALVASLMPSFFPKASLFSFWAALLPGIARALFDRQISRNGLPHLADLMSPSPLLSSGGQQQHQQHHVAVESLLRQVQLNQHLLGVASSRFDYNRDNSTVSSSGGVTDLEMEQLEQILTYSLSRS